MKKIAIISGCNIGLSAIAHIQGNQDVVLVEPTEVSFIPPVTKEDLRLMDTFGRKIYTGPYINKDKKLGRNSPCKCGSGNKYKKCCLIK